MCSYFEIEMSMHAIDIIILCEREFIDINKFHMQTGAQIALTNRPFI